MLVSLVDGRRKLHGFSEDSALRWSGSSTLRSSNECDISNNWEFVLKSFQANLHWILHSNLHKNCNLQKHMICYCDSIPDLLHLWFWRGATHNRFFHSIGTAYLAMTFIQNLRHEQPHLQVTDRDEMCVTLAGLCHDLGHPCFSHSDCLEIRVEWFLMLQAFTSSLKVQQVSGHMFESSLSWWGWVELFWREVTQEGRDQGTFFQSLWSKQFFWCMVLRMIRLVNMCDWAEHLHWFKLQKWADLSSRKLANCSFRYALTRAVWSFHFCYAQLLLLTGGSQVLDVQIYLHVFCVVWRSHNLRIPVRISGKKKVNHSRQISMFTQTHKPNGGLMFRNSMEFPDFQKTRKYGLPFIQAKWIHPWNLLNSFTLCPDFLRQLGKEKRSLSRFLTVWPYENVWQRMSSRTFGWNSTG